MEVSESRDCCPGFSLNHGVALLGFSPNRRPGSSTSFSFSLFIAWVHNADDPPHPHPHGKGRDPHTTEKKIEKKDRKNLRRKRKEFEKKERKC